MVTPKPVARRTAKPKHAYRLRVKLEGSEPAIWRLISVPGHMTLADLDRIIQAAMGWTNSHLHLFTIDGQFFGLPDDEWIEDKPLLPDTEFTLDEVLGTKVDGFSYEYDFGDSWHHDVTVQAVELANEARNGWPMCLAGAHACPPEDVGGLGGYEAFLEAIANPTHEEHDAVWQWWGGPFDPKGFDVNAANRAIRDWLSERRKG
jgi:hypothetical protein